MDALLRGVASVSTLRRIFFPPLMKNDLPAAKFSIDTGAGVIDADYRGILFVLLFNYGDQDFEGSFYDLSPPCPPSAYLLFLSSVNEGDRIAQLILERIYTPEISVVDVSTFVTFPRALH
jgi:hypothetical protein